MSELYSEKDVIAASQIWGILILAAKNRQTLTYKDLSPLVGRFQRHISLPLGIILRYCKKNKLPTLTVLVVDAYTQKPSFDFGEVQDIDKERGKVFKWVDNHWGDFKGELKNPGIGEFEKVTK